MRLLSIVAVAGLLPLAAHAQDAGFPYVDENCGFTFTYDAPPERAVTLSNNATELMLALGLEDHMVGTSYMANMQISPQYEEAYNAIPILSPLVATTEQLIDAETDFVYAGYPDGFSDSRNPRPMLRDLGIPTRLNTEGCNLGRFGFAELFEEIRSMAGIFGVPERGNALIADMEARIATVTEALEGVDPIPVFIYNGGEDTPRAVLGHTMLNHVVELAGGDNILGDVENRYGRTSWEQLVADAPEHIVVFYSGTSSGQVVENPEVNLGQARIATLEANPIIAGVPAVENDAYALVVSVIGQPGPSSIDALALLARAFHPAAFE